MEKSIEKNALFNMLYKALSVIFPLIIVSYASRKLGANGIGVVSSAQNLVTYFTMFAALGIPSYGVRMIAQTKKNKEICNKTFTELFIINLISTFICALAYFILVKFLNAKLIMLNYIFGSLIIMNVFNVEWVYEGFEEYKYIAIRSFIIKGLSVIALFLFVNDSSDIFYYAGIVCFGTVGNYILNLLNLYKYVNFSFESLLLNKHIKIIMTFFGSVIAIELYSLLDITMLTYMTDSNTVGYYSNAAKVIKMLANTMTAIGAVLLPRLSLYFIEKKYDKIQDVVQKFWDIITLLAIPSYIGVCLISDKIVYFLFGLEFSKSISTICVLSPLILLMPLSGGLFGQLLLTSGEEKKYLKCVCLGAIFNLIFNFILIPNFGQNGAAFASVLTELIVSVSMIFYSNKIIKIKFDKKNMLKVILSTLLFSLVLTILHSEFINLPIFISLIVEIIVAVSIYTVCLCIFKHKFAIECMYKIKNKTKLCRL